MVIFGWNKALECGIPLLDQQHKQFIQYANTFFIKYRCTHDKESVITQLKYLQDYILYHFQAEEAFQEECGYYKYLDHQATHKIMATKLKFLSVELEESGFSIEKMEYFHTFLIEWIKVHVLTEDMEFAKVYIKYQNDKIVNNDLK